MPWDRITKKLHDRPDDRRQNDPTDGPSPGRCSRSGGIWGGTGLRPVSDGVRYIPSTGGRWRALPTDIHRIPPTGTVSTSGARAVRRTCPDSLRDPARQCAGRSPEPSTAAIDGRSVRTTKGSATARWPPG